LFGIWKGFHELAQLGLADSVPRMMSCEPEARGPLARSLSLGRDATSVAPDPTVAASIACTVSGYRGVHAIRSSAGRALVVSDEELLAAQAALAGIGLWSEISGAAGIAGLRRAVGIGEMFDGPVVAISTSSGFKSLDDGSAAVVGVEPTWSAVAVALRSQGIPA
jgi:threonine synthase